MNNAGKNSLRILFISRAFPPTVGGIEQQNADLARFLGQETKLTLIANARGKYFLPLFYPWAILRTLWQLPAHDVLLLGDGVLALLGAVAKFCFPHKTVITVLHGLDITYHSTVYQALWVKRFFRQIDGAIAVSRATKDEAVHRGFDGSKIFIIPNGIESTLFHFSKERTELSNLLALDTSEKIILLTIGRLVKRKGVAWFIRTVLPQLPAHFHYIVAGAGPEEAAIREAITLSALDSRVSLLGRVGQKERAILLANADMFVQPNIPVAGDIEGFGIAVIEASAAGLPVVASRLEGLQDAVTDGKNGTLVTPENSEEFVAAIQALQDPVMRENRGIAGQQFTATHFDWSVIAHRYVEVFEDFVKSTRDRH